MKNKIYLIALIAVFGGFGACTDLDEHPYSTIVSDNFYQQKENIYQGIQRVFEFANEKYVDVHRYLNEGSADQFVVCAHSGTHGDLFYAQEHYHTWTIDVGHVNEHWESCFKGVAYCNSAISDLNNLDPLKYGMSVAEHKNLIAQLRGMRAFYYTMLIDFWRNVPIVTDFSNPVPPQATGKEVFDFIEKELKEIMPTLNVKSGTGGNGIKQGQVSQGFAAALLMRLYLNGKVWANEDHFADCATVCQDIIDGKYGNYSLSDRWDAPFDWNNDKCDEVIYAFSITEAYQTINYDWWTCRSLEPGSEQYFGFTGPGSFGFTSRFMIQPSLDLHGNEYNFANGTPIKKFKKYPDDVRLKKYRNIAPGQREGMFVYGYLPYVDAATGETVNAKASQMGGCTIYLRDQIGWFGDTDPASFTPAPSSAYFSGVVNMTSAQNVADSQSGWRMVKYPLYPAVETEHNQQADNVVVRLAEVYYALAECKFRTGNPTEAARLLDAVRKRNYPNLFADYSYVNHPNLLTEQELLDEWGREFLGEMRRRTDLIRFGAWETAWWDKPANSGSSDGHTNILPISRKQLNANLNLRQNPGYEDIVR
jgi:hypothetical protein